MTAAPQTRGPAQDGDPPTPDVAIRKDRRAGRITFTRPQALNALSHEMAVAIHRALDDWRGDPGVALVIIDAEGDRAFCAGGDIAAVYHGGKAGDHGIGQRFFADEYRMNAEIADFAKPIVAFMQGFVMGGGVGVGELPELDAIFLSYACALIDATPRTLRT